MLPWNADSSTDPVDQLVSVSRLIGCQQDLVLHGGGNTSLKTPLPDVFGESREALYIKGSGSDLSDIDRGGFAVTDLALIRRLLTLAELSDDDMVNELRRSLLDVSGPNPSLETILHGFLPHRFVIHTHADSFLAVSNTLHGAATLNELFGDTAVSVEYRRPGLPLALACVEAWAAAANDDTIALFLEHHGVFTFGETAEEAYTRMAHVIDTLDAHIQDATVAVHADAGASFETAPDVVEIAAFRAQVSAVAGRPLVMSRSHGTEVSAFVGRANLGEIVARGPVTPDHVIRTKPRPMVGRDLSAYASQYSDYFTRWSSESEDSYVMLDPAPRIVLDQEWGLLSLGENFKAAQIASDIYHQTISTISTAEALGGYVPLAESSLFEFEYWSLERAKLKLTGSPSGLVGQVAIVTGAASGIGRACAEKLLHDGAAVCGVDLDPSVVATFDHPGWLGITADVSEREQIQQALADTVGRFGGIDVAVVAAGIFGSSTPIAELSSQEWREVMSINLDAVFDFFHDLHPILAVSPTDARVVVIASKNVPAPGRGAAAYSTSKAALVQLCRVAALEWADDAIRLNMVHPDAVFDTGLWTPELLDERASRYGLTVAEYKRRNLLGTEVSSASVAALVSDMCGPGFVATTGAQVPIDGGSDRVI